MINLTPDKIKENTVYAKRNSRLLRYLLISGFTMFCILVITGITLVDMTQTKSDYEDQLAGQNAKIESYKTVEQKGQALYDQVSTIKELLNRQIKFSEMFPDFAKILPEGSIILALDFNANDFIGDTTAGQKTPTKPEDKPFVIRAATVDSQTATTLLENIKARTDLFVGADIIDVVKIEPSTSGTENQVASRYPYQVTINAYLKQKNQKTGSSTTQEKQVLPTPADPKTETAI